MREQLHKALLRPGLLGLVMLAVVFIGGQSVATGCGGSHHFHAPDTCHAHCRNAQNMHNLDHGSNCGARPPTTQQSPIPRPQSPRGATPTPTATPVTGPVPDRGPVRGAAAVQPTATQSNEAPPPNGGRSRRSSPPEDPPPTAIATRDPHEGCDIWNTKENACAVYYSPKRVPTPSEDRVPRPDDTDNSTHICVQADHNGCLKWRQIQIPPTPTG